jgi:phosphate transport system permease protein
MSDIIAPALRRPKGAALDPVFKWTCTIAATILLTSLAGLMGALLVGGWPAFQKFGFSFLTRTVWDPVNDVYGGAGPIVGTLLTSLFALAMALPVATGIAIFLVEFCPRMVARPIGIAVELLAGIPSIVYGIWGLFVFAPFLANDKLGPNGEILLDAHGNPVHTAFQTIIVAHVEKLRDMVDHGPAWLHWLGWILPPEANVSNIFTASLILAIMILPYMSAVFRELLLTVPPQVRESAYGLGALPHEVIGKVCIPYISRSAVGVVMLGLGRALGETMAVTFVIGNNPRELPKHIFDSGATIASTIANEFNEADGMHRSALIALGFVLFLITFSVLAVARALLSRDRTA